VQNTFLHSVLEEDVYMKPRYVDSSHPHHVCKLDKALYGLKQASCALYNRLSTKLVQLGFHISKAGTSLFIYIKSRVTIYLLVYVDDIVVTSSSSTAVTALLNELHYFLGELHYFLGIQVAKVDGGISLSQEKYALEIFLKAGMHKCKPVKTPLVMSDKLSLTGAMPLSSEDATRYRSLVGGLQYLATACYLICSQLKFHSFSSLKLSAFSDGDWAGCPEDRRSIGGFIVYLGSNLCHGVHGNN
jgi:hypothetical protein